MVCVAHLNLSSVYLGTVCHSVETPPCLAVWDSVVPWKWQIGLKLLSHYEFCWICIAPQKVSTPEAEESHATVVPLHSLDSSLHQPITPSKVQATRNMREVIYSCTLCKLL